MLRSANTHKTQHVRGWWGIWQAEPCCGHQALSHVTVTVVKLGADHRKRLSPRCPSADRLRHVQWPLNTGSSTTHHLHQRVCESLQALLSYTTFMTSCRHTHHRYQHKSPSNPRPSLPKEHLLSNSTWWSVQCSWENNDVHHLPTVKWIVL